MAEATVGQLRFRPRGEPPPAALLRMVANLIGLELERARGPRACQRGGRRRLPRRPAHAAHHRPREHRRTLGRARLRPLRRRHRAGRPRPPPAPRGGRLAGPRADAGGARRARAWSAASLAALVAAGAAGAHGAERRARDPRPRRRARAAARAAAAVLRELEAGLAGFQLTVARSAGRDADPADLHRAGAEALLAANVAEARGLTELSLRGDRRLPPAAARDERGPGASCARFYDETVAPLVAYDDQYETDLVRTLESFLDADGNVARTAERLFTHRHTVRYRLERVRELTALDVSSTDGRERLASASRRCACSASLPPGGPAQEKGDRGRARARGSPRTANAREGSGLAIEHFVRDCKT